MLLDILGLVEHRNLGGISIALAVRTFDLSLRSLNRSTLAMYYMDIQSRS